MPRRDPAAKRDADARYVRTRSLVSRDIAAGYPPPGDRARRDVCALDLRRFCETYLPATFALDWSDDHLKVIARLEETVLRGGLFALAMPRGSGKSSLCRAACLWAMLYRHRSFVCLIGATEKRAVELLKHLKHELAYNDLLAADHRQVCYPLACLEGSARRASGQLFRGEPTRIEWAKDRLTFPTMPDHALDGPDVSGSTITVAGLTGAIRGQSHTLPDGTIVRPELVVLDDPQSRESAMSPSQSADRAAIISGDVLGMAGPGAKIAAVMPCTVIREGDTADVLLDRERNARWQGEKLKLVYAFPAAEQLWEEYAKLRAEGFRPRGNKAAATEFYRANQADMDAGARVAWLARYRDDELSAIQHAMNLKIDDEPTFQAEYQNSPSRPDESEAMRLTADQIARKVNGVPRDAIPTGAEILTAAIDVHDTLLYFTVCAWSPEFTGWIVRYGACPDPRRRYYTMRKAPRTLAAHYPGTGREGAIRAGLVELTDALLGREWAREDGASLRINRCLIDAGYCPDIVHDVCRHSQHAAVLTPARGLGIGAAAKPISEYDRSRGRIGHHWYFPSLAEGRALRQLRHDANYWKSFIHARLAVALGDPGCLSLFGRDPEEHRLLADHMTAESPIRTQGHGRTLDEWRLRPDKSDNHLFDVVVAAAAAASYSGVSLLGAEVRPTPKRQRLTMAEMQRRARERR